MAIKLLAVNDVENEGLSKYIVDTENEKNNIPIKDLTFGTKCFVVESGIEYVLNSVLEWVEKEG